MTEPHKTHQPCECQGIKTMMMLALYRDGKLVGYEWRRKAADDAKVLTIWYKPIDCEGWFYSGSKWFISADSDRYRIVHSGIDAYTKRGNEMTNLYRQTPEQWIISDDTGVSSTTIWAVMMGVEYRRPSVPYDSSDFGRCYRLLKHVPEWLPRLSEVAEKYPGWKPIIREWDTLTFLHETEQCDKLNRLLSDLRKEVVECTSR